MATIVRRTSKDGHTTYLVRVRRKGAPSQTATFQKLSDAKKYAQITEGAVLEGRHFETASLPDIFESLHCHIESHRNRRVFTQQGVQQAQSELEHTEITAVATMENTPPTVLCTQRTKRDDPEVGEAGGHPEPRETRGL